MNYEVKFNTVIMNLKTQCLLKTLLDFFMGHLQIISHSQLRFDDRLLLELLTVPAGRSARVFDKWPVATVTMVVTIFFTPTIFTACNEDDISQNILTNGATQCKRNSVLPWFTMFLAEIVQIAAITVESASNITCLRRQASEANGSIIGSY